MSRAAEKGDEAVVELLLKNGAQPDFKDPCCQTLLLRAERGGRLRAKRGGSAAVLQLLNRAISQSQSR